MQELDASKQSVVMSTTARQAVKAVRAILLIVYGMTTVEPGAACNRFFLIFGQPISLDANAEGVRQGPAIRVALAIDVLGIGLPGSYVPRGWAAGAYFLRASKAKKGI
ncbi:hypothetical protein CYMTET_11638 [Cymbomonas tetramitiformis]|uniref:Uncharacterized protein n=1 Tax=Cymbomonas tetramitiformis TaxID=36881 RepID=A0AAE0GM46_9CHLO|nr:hypothetical protein CYMTET_11638 [Cymbomonas tetramitiformis]